MMILILWFIGLFLAILGTGEESRTIRGKRKYKKLMRRIVIWKDDDYQ